MPGKDGTGPMGKGQITDRDRGQGARYGRVQVGKGKMGGPFSAGPGGECYCPDCNYKIAHLAGQPCNEKWCPKCGAKLTRR